MNANTDCLKIPNYEFWIESEGERLKQYQTRTINELGSTVISCYVASKVGKEFCIGTRKLIHNHPVLFHFYLNDDRVAGRVNRTTFYEASDEIVSCMHTRAGNRRFAFAAIKFEEDEYAELRSIPKNLGTIRVEVFRIKNIQAVDHEPPLYDINTLNMSTLSEKTKAVGSHTISVLEPEPIVETIPVSSYDYIDSPRTPWYIIKFFYRSLDILQAEGIAPAPLPQPAPSEEPGVSRQQLPRGSGFGSIVQDRKPIVKTVKSEGSRVNAATKGAGGLEQPIVIEDSDEEDFLLKYMLEEKIKRSRGSSNAQRGSSNAQGGRKKRARITIDDHAIHVINLLDLD